MDGSFKCYCPDGYDDGIGQSCEGIYKYIQYNIHMCLNFAEFCWFNFAAKKEKVSFSNLYTPVAWKRFFGRGGWGRKCKI